MLLGSKKKKKNNTRNSFFKYVYCHPVYLIDKTVFINSESNIEKD